MQCTGKNGWAVVSFIVIHLAVHVPPWDWVAVFTARVNVLFLAGRWLGMDIT